MDKFQKILNNAKLNNNKICIDAINDLEINEEEFYNIMKKLYDNKIEITDSNIEVLSDKELGEQEIFIMDDLKKYYLEISKYKVLSQKEEQELLIKYSLGDKKAEETLIKCNLKLVINIAKKYNLINCSSIDFMDLIQEGNLMLYKALKKFDIKKETRFSTYATWWIRNKINRTISEQSRTIKVSSYAAENLRKIRKYREKYFDENQGNPSVEQIMNYLDISMEELNLILRAEQNIVSLDMPLIGDEGFTLHDSIGNEMEIGVEEKATSNVNVEYILDTMKKVLDEREFMIISLRVGFVDGKEWTYNSIGKKIGVSHQRVKEIEKVVLKKIKSRLLYENKLKKVKRIIKE